MLRYAIHLFVLLTGALPAMTPLAAQTLPVPLAGAEEIPFEEWSAMSAGRTLVYRIDGEVWALEYYYPGTNRVALQLNDGKCLQGTWDYSAPYYCFHWEAQGTACFRHTRRDGEILVMESGSGNGTAAVQHMSAVTDIPLSCGPDLTS